MTPTKERVGHTPGPWRAEFGENSGYDSMTAAWNINSVPQGGTVCVVDYGDYGSSHFDSTPNPQADANARLIAAAPQLLEALRGVESTYVFLDSMTAGTEPQHTNTITALAAVRAAIRAAEGE